MKKIIRTLSITFFLINVKSYAVQSFKFKPSPEEKTPSAWLSLYV